MLLTLSELIASFVVVQLMIYYGSVVHGVYGVAQPGPGLRVFPNKIFSTSGLAKKVIFSQYFWQCCRKASARLSKARVYPVYKYNLHFAR